jgi:hypothetical protein
MGIEKMIEHKKSLKICVNYPMAGGQNTVLLQDE